tara:strand:- start:482 stop:829 length:348 start_codon:yes stop_codon:yes gene_type:complete
MKQIFCVVVLGLFGYQNADAETQKICTINGDEHDGKYGNRVWQLISYIGIQHSANEAGCEIGDILIYIGKRDINFPALYCDFGKSIIVEHLDGKPVLQCVLKSVHHRQRFRGNPG